LGKLGVGNTLPGLMIRSMRQEDLAFAAECTAAEGWASENYTTLEGFYMSDQHSCLVAELGGHRVGICVATCYANSGFIGELIVRPEQRGMGVGQAFLDHGVSYLKNKGVETVYLDGVLKAVELYERNGFHKVCRSWRFFGQVTANSSPRVRRMAFGDMPEVVALDKRSFGEDRSFFLRRRLAIYPELSYVQVVGGDIAGYILGRSGEGWISAGPWVMSEQIENPGELLSAFALSVGGQPFSLGILDVNRKACDFLRSLGFVEAEDSPWRMALGASEDLGTSPQCFAVGSAAKG
jgi:ribosomal protein S18 acetylase RimI-like enzyme